MLLVDLTAVVPEAYMKRFLIYAESNSECGYGRLRSLSGESGCSMCLCSHAYAI